MTIWRTRVECWIHKATNTHSEYVILLFHWNNGCTNAPQCYVIPTLPVYNVSFYLLKAKINLKANMACNITNNIFWNMQTCVYLGSFVSAVIVLAWWGDSTRTWGSESNLVIVKALLKRWTNTDYWHKNNWQEKPRYVLVQKPVPVTIHHESKTDYSETEPRLPD